MKPKLIEKEGKFFKADEKGEILMQDGKEVLATEEEIKAFKEPEPPAIDLAKASLEDLAKVNPQVAQHLQEQREREAKEAEEKRKREEEQAENSRKSGDFQKLYEDTDKKLKDKEGEVTKLQNLVGDYKGTVEELLADAIAQIPEDKRSLVPADYSPRKKLEYIRNNASVFGVSLVKGSKVPENDNKPPLNEETQLMGEIDDLMKKPKRTPSEDTLLWEKSKQLKEVRKAKGT